MTATDTPPAKPCFLRALFSFSLRFLFFWSRGRHSSLLSMVVCLHQDTRKPPPSFPPFSSNNPPSLLAIYHHNLTHRPIYFSLLSSHLLFFLPFFVTPR